MAAAVLATVAAIVVWSDASAAAAWPRQRVRRRHCGRRAARALDRSDGRGTPEQIAHAAARAGLKFVVITDHGDATRTPDPPVVSRRRAVPRRRRKSARAAATTSPSRCRPRRIRSAERRATSSRTSSGSADSGSSRIRIRRSPSCSGASGARRLTRIEIVNLDTSWRGAWPSRVARQGGLLVSAARPIRSVRRSRSRACSAIERVLTRWERCSRGAGTS